jgi:hypothetical protein
MDSVASRLARVNEPQSLLDIERTVYDFTGTPVRLALGLLVSHPEHFRGPDHHAPTPDIGRSASNNRIRNTTIFHLDRTLGCQRCSAPTPSALPAAARLALIATMSTKSRQVIYGGRIIEARIRAQGARDAAQKAVREADRAAAELWSI